MPSKASDTDFRHAVELYISGYSAQDAAAICHTSEERLRNYLKTHGLFRDKVLRYKIIGEKAGKTRRIYLGLPDEEIIRRYTSGESENALAKSFGVSRSAIRARLVANHIEIRDQVSANRLLAQTTPAEEHLRRIKIAQNSVRGRIVPEEEKVRRAITREQKALGRSQAEIMLVEWLVERGLEVTPQKAIGIYNVDIASYPVAVEIFGGSWHREKPGHIQRALYILNHGWHLIVIWTHARRSPISPSAADYIVTFLQEISSNPTSVGQYRVIRGDGKELAKGSADSDNITFVVSGYEGGSERAGNNSTRS